MKKQELKTQVLDFKGSVADGCWGVRLHLCKAFCYF